MHNFNPSTTDGVEPLAGLIIDRSGNLYGTTYEGGAQYSGTVFELSPGGNGEWTETVLHAFVSRSVRGTDGSHPYAALLLDGAGNLYGTTVNGGAYNYGTVFELTPSGGGRWTEKVLHSFNNNGSDGSEPFDALVLDSAGNLYGTTGLGGTDNAGSVFELSPNGSGGWNETVLYSFNSLGSGDGYAPYGGVVFDPAGNLYGATWEGGAHGRGAIFELSPGSGGGWTETVLHGFSINGSDGSNPMDGLFSDAAGNLFGTTTNGGTYNVGAMFEVSHSGTGGWIEKVYSFNFAGADGASPQAGLISDAAGNFYGTASTGGNSAAGSVFELSPNGSGGWTEKQLYSFGAGLDGKFPTAGLVLDANGNLYGTTSAGGVRGSGIVFELSPNGSGGWRETVLRAFDGATDGYDSLAGLIFDGAGNLYGTTSQGGVNFYGTAFELSPNGRGGWTETVLHSFGAGTDGESPVGNLIWDGAGNLYGTTYSGGTNNLGTVFELSPGGGGGWTETSLYSFSNNGLDAANPAAGLVFDNAGNLYGTTFWGGSDNWGAVFELSHNGGGGWMETVLYSFQFNNSDGTSPEAGLILDAAGNLFGTTVNGGSAYYGTAFELSPSGGGGWTETVLHNFGGAMDGSVPEAGLIMDHAGNLYGTTGLGGSGEPAVGTVFEITR